MKSTITTKLARQCAVALGLGLASAASMAASSWNLGGCTTQNTTNTGSFGNSYTCQSTGDVNAVTVSAFGAKGATGAATYASAFLKQNGSTSGFGVASQNEGISIGTPEHSMDNNATDGLGDLILLNFNTAVALNAITLGWSQSDADITVMAYTGGTAPSIAGKTASNLRATGAAGGWATVQNHGDKDASGATGYASSGTDIVYTNTANITSSWWLISSYNSGFGGGTLDSLIDYVKVLAISSKDLPGTGKVSEPASLALAGLALVGALGVRRRQRKIA